MASNCKAQRLLIETIIYLEQDTMRFELVQTTKTYIHTYNVILITVVTFDFVSTFSFEDNGVNLELNMMDERKHDFSTCWG